MSTVFDVFREVPLTYLVLNRARVYGNLIVSTKDITGVFKVRGGMNTVNGLEAKDSSATAHVHPQDFDNIDDIVGNGIRYNGVDYEIVGLTEGRNFATNAVEHYTLTLNRLTASEKASDNVIEDENVSEFE